MSLEYDPIQLRSVLEGAHEAALAAEASRRDVHLHSFTFLFQNIDIRMDFRLLALI